MEQAADVVEDATTVLRPHFHRPEAHQHARDYLLGLLAEVERKNGWLLAEQAGYGHPRGVQRVLDRYALGRRRRPQGSVGSDSDAGSRFAESA